MIATAIFSEIARLAAYQATEIPKTKRAVSEAGDN
jgi:hypothetical protein